MSLGAEFDPGRGPSFEGGIFVCLFFVPDSQQKGAVK